MDCIRETERLMDYVIGIFGLGLIVTFIVVIGLLRAAEFAKTESAKANRDQV